MKLLDSSHLEFFHRNDNEKNFVQFFPDFLALLKVNVMCSQHSKSRKKNFKPSSSSFLFQSVMRKDRTKDSYLLAHSQTCSCFCLMYSYQSKYSVRLWPKCQICNAHTRHKIYIISLQKHIHVFYKIPFKSSIVLGQDRV